MSSTLKRSLDRSQTGTFLDTRGVKQLEQSLSTVDTLRVDTRGIRTVTTTPYTVTADDRTILVNDALAGGAVTINLPTAVSNTGKILTIKKIEASYNVVIDAYSTEKIDNYATKTLYFQYDRTTIQSDGTAWWIID